MKRKAILTLFLLAGIICKGQSDHPAHLIFMGRIITDNPHDKSINFHSYLIDSSNLVVSYHISNRINQFEVYHDIELLSKIETYRLVITDHISNRGDLEFYYTLSNQLDTISITQGLSLSIDSVQYLKRKKYKKYMKKDQNKRLGSTLEPKYLDVEFEKN